ncbi:cysteine desulfurase family protein [Alkalihalobacillus trypoxylicola]|uniref:Cysteine desulfurase n=1 Tax=Alkalihalobacillus trypoxylicola TaxID=519424 RepID=A0A161PH64_9BACI|nr:cysteine desulfurase family protein [Alkalihalobacillus trypoxylicola]KYG32164.1 cysteine desulfurase [Alkalihalobacillus trypoxylicola]
MIYFDNSATTKPHEQVLTSYTKVASDFFGNPSSLHTLGLEAENLLEKSRKLMAEEFQVKAKEIMFTSGGTEGNNLAIKGTVFAKRKKGHLITTMIEHASSYEVFQELEALGYEVSYLSVNHEGKISVEELKQTIRDHTILVSVIHVNNETGSIQPIEEVGKFLKNYPQIRFHVDHVQGAIKVPLKVYEYGIDMCTISAHKFHGLKGTGMLYVKEGHRLSPLLHGGSQELKFRAGTENTAGIVAMTKAFRLERERQLQGNLKLNHLKNLLIEGLKAIEHVTINTPSEGSAPHIVNFSVGNIKPEILIQALAKEEIYVSTRSACSSKISQPSRVLLAMGLDDTKANSAIRISFSYDNTEEEVEMVLNHLKQYIPHFLSVTRV